GFGSPAAGPYSFSISLVMAPLSSGGSSWPTCTVLASSGMSDPLRDERVARVEDQLAGVVPGLGLQDHEVERTARARLLVDVADASGEGEFLAQPDGTAILELLLAVHQGHEVEPELEERARAARQRLGHEGDGIGERRRRGVGPLVGGIGVMQRSREGGDMGWVDSGAAGGELAPDHVSRWGHGRLVWRNGFAPVKDRRWLGRTPARPTASTHTWWRRKPSIIEVTCSGASSWLKWPAPTVHPLTTVGSHCDMRCGSLNGGV